MKKAIFCLLIFGMLLSACNGKQPSTTPTVEPTLVTLPTPKIDIQTQNEEIEKAVQLYFHAWKGEHYGDMYQMLSNTTSAAVSEEEFEKRHRAAYTAMTLKDMDFTQLSSMVSPSEGQVAYRITYNTNLLGTLDRDAVMNLVAEDGAWRIDWDATMIMPELKDGNYLSIEYKIPARGNIYDRGGYAMVSQTNAVSLGVVPARIDPETENDMLDLLARLTDQGVDQVKARYQGAIATWYIPIGDITAEVAQRNAGALDSFSGIVVTPFRARYYADEGLAPHVIGYTQLISEAELEHYQRLGYQGTEMVGRAGLELWGEQYLAGEHGLDLYVKDPNGLIVTKLATKESVPASSITTTIDSALQYNLQRSLGDLKGSITVMEREGGRVLAMASNPGFNPNIFEPTYPNNGDVMRVLTDPNLRLYNRATQGVYPLGSVFKMVTMAAGIETGVFQSDTMYYCGREYTELPGFILYDWVIKYDQPASGNLSLMQGLMRSCNPWFWHIGKTLWDQGYTTAIHDVAKEFGLGSKTGIEIEEDAGNVPQPQTVSDNVQLAIGQSTLQVSPIQVARFIAAIGNDGTLYRPTVIQSIDPVDGTAPLYEYKPDVQGKLKMKEQTILDIQQAMVWVVTNARGTAINVTRDMRIDIAGKTGTAETSTTQPHAWFAGYSWENNPDRPDIVVVVQLEHAGEGSSMAAPLFKRAIELYFSNNQNPGGTMPWEDRPYHVAPPEEETPTP